MPDNSRTSTFLSLALCTTLSVSLICLLRYRKSILKRFINRKTQSNVFSDQVIIIGDTEQQCNEMALNLRQ